MMGVCLRREVEQSHGESWGGVATSQDTRGWGHEEGAGGLEPESWEGGCPVETLWPPDQ